LKLILKKIVEYIPLNPPSKGDFFSIFKWESKKPPPPFEGGPGRDVLHAEHPPKSPFEGGLFF
jgi:hypothetical protein